MLDLRLDRPRTAFCRSMARKVLARCGDVCPDGWPCDLEKAVGCVLPGFIVVELSMLPPGVSAIVDPECRGIGVNGLLTCCRKRFAIAHEIGHLLLEHPEFVFGVQGRQDAILEREADMFASEFLVPAPVLQREFRKCRDYEQLAVLFKVEREVMYYRFRSAGLLRQVM